MGDMKIWATEFMGIKAFEQVLLEYVMHDLFDRNIRTGEAFQRYAGEVRLQILPAGQKAIHTARPVLKAYFDCLSALRGLEPTNRFNKPVQQFLAELRLEMGNMVPPQFLTLYSEERLTHIIRYLKALTIRANRGTVHLEKDMTKAQELKPFVAWYEDISSSLPAAATDEKRKALEEFRWMLEEYKISLFAQELKTAFPISPKRLQERMQAIEMIF
jgi:ATP-dependent helicase HrpA